MIKQPKILFTGGGSAGHVTPNIALIEKFRAENWQIAYIGTADGLEKTLISKLNVAYYSIPCGKLRRYFSWKNFIDPFKIGMGFLKSLFLLLTIKPNVIFAKGGFVSFPVVVAAKFLRIPVAVHESDLTPGLANKLCAPFATKICLAFAGTLKFLANNPKAVVTGSPIRTDLFKGNTEKGKQLCGFSSDKKIILVYGGGLGAEKINQTLRLVLPKLLMNYQIAHLCGKGKTDANFDHLTGYKQFEYLHEEFADVMACADLVISRSGANAVYELIALKKLNILIPLATNASRGEQVFNAKYFAEKNCSYILPQDKLEEQSLFTAIAFVTKHEEQFRAAMAKENIVNGTDAIYKLLMTIKK